MGPGIDPCIVTGTLAVKSNQIAIDLIFNLFVASPSFLYMSVTVDEKSTFLLCWPSAIVVIDRPESKVEL